MSWHWCWLPLIHSTTSMYGSMLCYVVPSECDMMWCMVMGRSHLTDVMYCLF